MILPELATYIAANSTLVAGTDLFMNQFPATASDTAVALYETGGVGPKVTFGGVAWESPSVQVVVRSTSYAVARNLAQTIFNKLLLIENDPLPVSASTGAATTNHLFVRPQQSPFSIGPDELDRPQVSCNYFVEKGVSSA